MDIKKEFDPKNDNVQTFDIQIKEEPELLIDNEWIPTKFEDEENEYYQEYFEKCNQIFVKTENEFEAYTIKLLDENEDNVDNENYGSDYYADSSSDEDFDTLKKCFEDIDFSSTPDKQGALDSDTRTRINRWLTDNFVEYECPVCTERFFKYILLRKHLEQNHEEIIEESEKKYFIGSDNCGVCKKCSKKFSTISLRYFHSMKHDKNDAKLEFIICKICNFKTNNFFVQKHISEEHPEVLKQFTFSPPLGKAKIKCPLCSYSYKTRKQLWHHFMDNHPHESKVKTLFSCHICVQEAFDEEDLFLQHLTEYHNLNTWQILHYRKVIEEKEYVACTECGCLFFQNDTIQLLKHFLKHINNSFWTCKFCSKKSSFKITPLRHMCFKIIEYYNNRNYDSNINNIDNNPEQKALQIRTLQEFENYVAHVCPFCNKEFIKMLKWQQHLRKVHSIETLKGLEMKKVVNDNNKLCCVICHALVVNSPEKLHAHRFQHLPFKPYKCLLCCCPLTTFEMAVNHVSKSCKDEDDRNFVRNVWIGKTDDSILDMRSFLEIQCSICNHKKFNDVKSSLQHYQDVHNNFEELFIKSSGNVVTCKICFGKLVNNDRNPCFLHIMNHFDEKTFQCKLCLQSYATLKGITFHFLSHPSTKALSYHHSCKTNEQKIGTVHDKKDIKPTTNVTKLAVSTIKSHVLNEFAEFIAFVCPECNEDVGSQPNWHTHIATKHNFFNESDVYFKDVDGSLKCTTCKIKLPPTPIQQQKHKLTHMPYKSFMCNLCYKRCNSLGVLYGHFRRKHFANGSFGCPICPEILQTSHQRTKHLTDKHPRKEWPHSLCLICYKVMKNVSSLRVHMRTHDVDRVKYTCEICGAKIVELKDFNLHMERHKNKGEVKEKFCDGETSNTRSEYCQSNDAQAQRNFLEELQDVPKNENKRKLNDKCILSTEIEPIPAIKKIKNEPQEI